MIYKVLVALSLVVASSASLYSEDPTHLKKLWEQFKKQYNRHYNTMDEENMRFGHFVDNLKLADSRNLEEAAAHGSAVHGITKFFDWSKAEFESRLLTLDPKAKRGDSENISYDTMERKLRTNGGLVDWTDIYTTAVKDQGYCGSCWAFSATEQIEADAIRAGQIDKTTLLSPQQITSCDPQSGGCNGGWPYWAFDYVIDVGGIEKEEDYPYSSSNGRTGMCKDDASKFVVSVKSWTRIKGEDNMAAYVQGNGPVSICVDASNWSSYKGGIMKTCGKSINHAVQATGVDPSTGGFWKVRNSWGPSWGEDGYIRLAYGENTCGLTYDTTYVTMA